MPGMDKTVLGWILSGGATHWTAGGLQALDLRGTGSRALRGYQESGYGVVSGFGPVFAHFPGLDLTVAVLVNDVIHGRKAAEELVTAVLQGFGVAPSWPKMTMNVVADAAAMANSKDAAPLLDAVGGMEGLSHLMQMGSAEAFGAVDVRFVSDWIVIVFSIFITGFFILIQQSIWDLAALVQEMPPYDPTALAAEMENHEKSWTLILDRVDEAAFFFDYFRVALFWYTLVIATQFSKIFAGQPKLAQLMSAFTHASEEPAIACFIAIGPLGMAGKGSKAIYRIGEFG
eukprot:g2552.t1